MRRVIISLLVLSVLACSVSSQDVQQWQAEVDRINSELDEALPKRRRSEWIIAGGAVLALAGLVIAGNGYDENENVKSWPMVVGGFSTAAVGAGAGIGFGISWAVVSSRVKGLRSERSTYLSRIRAVERRDELVEEYGPQTASAIIDGEIFVGMEGSAVRKSWGRPDDINRTLTDNKTVEQWVYRRRRSYVYVENGVVRTIQD